MLSLEAEDVNMARRCVRSLLSDMESGMWALPDLGGDAVGQPGGPGRCFPRAAPLADADHMLHRTIGEIQNGFSADEKCELTVRDEHLIFQQKNFCGQKLSDLEILLHEILSLILFSLLGCQCML